uniref:Uncharacterized protein n=1 Tax=viral metagenome TaxID=1070528 RepID=A0A6C0HSF0_9ZZZZ
MDPNQKYHDLYNKFLGSLKERNYFFEVIKCCGYSELVSCTKEDSLKRLYEVIQTIFHTQNIKLYVGYKGVNVWIPKTDDIKIGDYLRQMEQKAEYPIPCNVVYKIFLDDGHCHVDHNMNRPFANVICNIHTAN